MTLLRLNSIACKCLAKTFAGSFLRKISGEAYAQEQDKAQEAYTYEADGTICIKRYFGGEKVVRVPDEIDGVAFYGIHKN